MSKIQFTVDDVVRKFDELISKGPIVGRKTVSELAHEFKNYNGGPQSFSELILFNHEYLNTSQKAHISNIHNISRVLTYSINQLAENARNKIQLQSDLAEGKIEQNVALKKLEAVNDDIRRESRTLVRDAYSLTQFTPLINQVIEQGRITKDTAELLSTIDNSANILIYCYNLQLAPNFERTEYLPATDIKRFCDMNKYNDGKIQPIVYTGYFAEATVKGRDNDILKRAIIPLYNNADKHAYVKSNDIHNKLADPEFKKMIKIESEVAKDKNLIKYIVRDNGFGISERVKDALLTREGVTNRDNPDDTGQGLWAVKSFVESLSGTIGFNTELGKGTEFYFTIPYNQVTNGTYVTEQKIR